MDYNLRQFNIKLLMYGRKNQEIHLKHLKQAIFVSMGSKRNVYIKDDGEESLSEVICFTCTGFHSLLVFVRP